MGLHDVAAAIHGIKGALDGVSEAGPRAAAAIDGLNAAAEKMLANIHAAANAGGGVAFGINAGLNSNPGVSLSDVAHVDAAGGGGVGGGGSARGGGFGPRSSGGGGAGGGATEVGARRAAQPGFGGYQFGFQPGFGPQRPDAQFTGGPVPVSSPDVVDALTRGFSLLIRQIAGDGGAGLRLMGGV